MATLIKIILLIVGFIGFKTLATRDWFPILNATAFSIGAQSISWLLVLMVAILGGGFVMLKAK